MNKISLISLALSFLFTSGCMYAHSSNDESNSAQQAEEQASSDNNNESNEATSDDSENKAEKKTKKKRTKKHRTRVAKHARHRVSKSKGEEFTKKLNEAPIQKTEATDNKSK
ncbi:MAG: hypothetical protein IJ848_04305 [Alphaproteobacteria bacterium]|nr:hypothetical protein [Alphaproteobacteria bacterium]